MTQQSANSPEQGRDSSETQTAATSARREREINALTAMAERHAGELARKDIIIELLTNEAAVNSAAHTRMKYALKRLEREASGREIELASKDTIIELLQNEKLILNSRRDQWPGALASLDWFAGSVRRAPGRWLRSFNRRRRKLRRKLLPKKSEQK